MGYGLRLAQYHDGKEDAIGKWHWGVGLKANKECVKRSGDKRGFASTDVGRKMAASGKATWGGVGGLQVRMTSVFDMNAAR